jgi:hypothetical protein
MNYDDSEFNKTINEIIKTAIGRNIIAEIDAGVIENLPKNFELVDDFQPEAYSINGSITNS